MERGKQGQTQDFSQVSGNCLSIMRQVFGGFLNGIRESGEIHARVSHYRHVAE